MTGNDEQIAQGLVSAYRADDVLFIPESIESFMERNDVYREIVLLRELFFPLQWSTQLVKEIFVVKKVNELRSLFVQGISPYFKAISRNEVDEIVGSVLEQLPVIRRILKMDVLAAMRGDPAANSYTEIIRSYPGLMAMLAQRVAKVLYDQGAKSYARELMEHIHSRTGIDIHPGADIGKHFFIDHGTGVVIGETTVIGQWARVYQGVTLGVLHFDNNGSGEMKRNYKRHPTIGNHVVLGAGAKLLGPITVGDHVNIGANSWVAENIPPYSTVYVAEHPKLEKRTRKKRGNDPRA